MPNQTFELSQLESHLWESANILRGPVDAANKKACEFYTPRSVVRLMIDMLDPREGETIYDPACGTDAILANSANLSIPLYVKRLIGADNGEGQATTLPVAWEQWQAGSAPFWRQMDTLVDTLDGLADQENEEHPA